jgi:DNA-binding CsgD family transcriptional regulator
LLWNTALANARRGGGVNQEDIERALDACYDAILTPEAWPRALHALARALDAAAMVFYPVNPTAGTGDQRDPNRPLQQMPMSPEYADLIEEYIRNQWYVNHYRAERGVPLLESGRAVVLEHDLATDDERKKLAVYNELYLPYGFPGFAVTGFRVDGQLWAVPIARAPVQGHFTPQEAPRLAALAPHFARMIRLADRLAQGQAAAEIDTLDRLGCAAILLDWRGTVVRVNRHADALLGDGLKVCRGALMASDTRSNRDLQQLVGWVRAGPLSRAALPHRRVVVRRADRSPLIVEALPVAGLTADAFSQARALLVITDIERRPPVPEDLLRSAFGLTPAEARLACRLADGDRLEEAAEALGIARNTARTQLKAVFAKTGTGRQSELAALLGRLARRPIDSGPW